jgi:hypothetical protein
VAYLDVSSKCGGLGLKEIIPLSDGNIVFRCDNSPDHFIGQDTPFHSAELGALVTVGNGTSHTRLVVSQSGIFSLLATNDAETPVTGLPAGISVIHARTHGTGFALYGSVQGEMQLWHVASSGAATAAGTYGQPPEGFVPDPVGRIDGAGKLYTLGSGPDGRVVLRFDPTGAEGKVIFDDAAQRAEDASSAHPRLRNLLSRGTLFTGP